MHSLNENKIQREVSNLKKNLLQERSLKLGAFQKVDELQSHLYDLEDEITTNIPARPQTSINMDDKVKLVRRSNSTNGMNTASKSVSAFPRLNGSANVTPTTTSTNHDIIKQSLQTSLLSTRPKTVIQIKNKLNYFKIILVSYITDDH